MKARLKVGDLVIHKNASAGSIATFHPVLVVEVSDRSLVNDYSSFWFLSENPVSGWLAAVDYEVISESR